MNAQERTEKVLRDIHILFSKAESYNGSKKQVVVNKTEVMNLLKELNSSMYQLMEEYELTAQSRNKAEREYQKKGEAIIRDAKKNADDIYAASIMYTDNALLQIQKQIDEANERVKEILQDTDQKLQDQKQKVRTNQTELKGNLQDLIDTEKYLNLIEDENRRRAREEAKIKEKAGYAAIDASSQETALYADMKPEIHVNPAYFQQRDRMNEETKPPKMPEESPLTEEEQRTKRAEAYLQQRKQKKEEEDTHERLMDQVLGIFGKKN